MEKGKRADPNASSSRPEKKKVLGTNALQMSENEASRLIGSIVEKGMFDDPPANSKPFFNPVPPPKPTVLPFPVARHRSHGPVNSF